MVCNGNCLQGRRCDCHTPKSVLKAEYEELKRLDPDLARKLEPKDDSPLFALAVVLLIILAGLVATTPRRASPQASASESRPSAGPKPEQAPSWSR